MGIFTELYPGQYEEIARKVQQDMAAEKEATERAGYQRLTGWFGALLDEFRESHTFGPIYSRDGKIYGWLQVRFELGLDAEKNPYVDYDAPPADLAHWLERKEWWKKKLGVNYDESLKEEVSP
jgi:hypothetical protein